MNRTIQDVRVYATPEALAAAAAEEFFMRAARTRANGQLFSCALSGGSTPARLFARMSDAETLARLPAGFWNSVHFFWGDERDVPPDHPDSNYRLAREALFDKIDIPNENLHPIQAGLHSASTTAISYENELKRFFALQPGAIPRLDLILLGMGDDGHTASLFPHSETLRERKRLVAAPWVARLDTHRITLTLPVINNAACILFLIQGSGKAEVLKRVLKSTLCPDLLPAQAIQPAAGELLWLLDQAAASGLDGIAIKSLLQLPGGYMPQPELIAIHNPGAGRFEFQKDGHLAVLEYHLSKGKIVFTHTGVPEALGGQGIGALLARSGLDYARAQSFAVEPLCSFIAGYIQKHPDYKSLIK